MCSEFNLKRLSNIFLNVLLDIFYPSTKKNIKNDRWPNIIITSLQKQVNGPAYD
jgi:hypothetical protein